MNICKFRYRKGSYWILIVVGFFVLAQFAVGFGWVRLPSNLVFFNRSGSLPVGYYIAFPMDDLHEGDLVRVELPKEMEVYAFERGWMKPGEMLLKKVGALPGDFYHVDDQGFEINGRYVGPVYDVDSKGLPMPVLRGDFVVKESCFLPVADRIPNSFDGRYFGDVPLSSIKGKVVPLFVFK